MTKQFLVYRNQSERGSDYAPFAIVEAVDSAAAALPGATILALEHSGIRWPDRWAVLTVDRDELDTDDLSAWNGLVESQRRYESQTPEEWFANYRKRTPPEIVSRLAECTI